MHNSETSFHTLCIFWYFQQYTYKQKLEFAQFLIYEAWYSQYNVLFLYRRGIVEYLAVLWILFRQAQFPFTAKCIDTHGDDNRTADECPLVGNVAKHKNADQDCPD